MFDFRTWQRKWPDLLKRSQAPVVPDMSSAVCRAPSAIMGNAIQHVVRIAKEHEAWVPTTSWATVALSR